MLDEHILWDDIAILARYLLLLSFNNQLDGENRYQVHFSSLITCFLVVTHLPYIFHFVTVLVNSGPVSLRASINGLVINIIHSLCTCSEPAFSGKMVMWTHA